MAGQLWCWYGCAAGAVVCSFGPGRPARSADDPAPGRALYHTDAKHLWNRLHEALLVRTGPDGREYGRDRLEPLLWSETAHFPEDRLRAVDHGTSPAARNGPKNI